MPYYYAQIDPTTKVVLGLSNLSGEVIADYMILLSEAQFSDITLLGKTYSNGQFV